MTTSTEWICYLCGARLGSKGQSAKKRGYRVCTKNTRPHSRSRMHYAHVKGQTKGRKRFRSLSDGFWTRLGISDPSDWVEACYECHEEVLHNPVIKTKDLKRLRQILHGKSFEQKVRAVATIFSLGIKAYSTNWS